MYKYSIYIYAEYKNTWTKQTKKQTNKQILNISFIIIYIM